MQLPARYLQAIAYKIISVLRKPHLSEVEVDELAGVPELVGEVPRRQHPVQRQVRSWPRVLPAPRNSRLSLRQMARSSLDAQW